MYKTKLDKRLATVTLLKQYLFAKEYSITRLSNKCPADMMRIEGYSSGLCEAPFHNQEKQKFRPWRCMRCIDGPLGNISIMALQDGGMTKYTLSID